MTVLYSDAFNRTVTSNTTSWGTSSDGHAWASYTGGSTNTLAVSTATAAGLTNYASLASATGVSNIYYLGTSQTDGEILAYVGQLITANAIAKAYQRGSLGTGVNGYSCYLSNSVLGIGKVVNTAITILASTAFSRTTTDTYWIRFRVQGTTLSGRVWANGSSEPSTWTVTVNDSTYASGVAGMGGYPSAGTIYYGSYSFDNLALPTPLATMAQGKNVVRGQTLTRSRVPFALRGQQRTKAQGGSRLRALSGQRSTSRSQVRTTLWTRGRTIQAAKSTLSTPTRVQMQGKSLMWGRARGVFKSQAPGHLSAASPFIVKAILSTKGLGSQRVRGMLKSIAQIRLTSQSPLRTAARARFSSRLLITTIHQASSRLRARFVAPARSFVSTRALFTALARVRDRLRVRLLTWAWMETMTRIAGETPTRTSFTTTALQRFALRLVAEVFLRSRHVTRSRMRYTITKTFTGVTLMFITFAEVRPTGYSGGIKPNTTIATQLTVTDQNGSPVNGLAQCNVIVTDPLGNPSAYTLGDSIISDSIISKPGGIYWCTYNTTCEGIYTELWSLIAPDGVEIASHKNTFRVAY